MCVFEFTESPSSGRAVKFVRNSVVIGLPGVKIGNDFALSTSQLSFNVRVARQPVAVLFVGECEKSGFSDWRINFGNFHVVILTLFDVTIMRVSIFGCADRFQEVSLRISEVLDLLANAIWFCG